ncbi:MAG: class I SAM-dependent methyltransferase [Candidatus Electryonea clarkiae]|nr:class I SAM-dependent methyltransferase [Candidatus Electryonea clarkiae]
MEIQTDNYKDQGTQLLSTQGRFVIGTGLGHNGSAWLADLLNRPELNMKAFHEIKMELVGKNWIDLHKYEQTTGIDNSYLPYLKHFDELLNNHSVVSDCNSWAARSIPALNNVFPIDNILYIVRNGIQSVHSIYHHNLENDQLKWLEDRFLKEYWEMFDKPGENWENRSSWNKWCFWWSLNDLLPAWLRKNIPSSELLVVRFEDLSRNNNEIIKLLKYVSGEESISISETGISRPPIEETDITPENIWEQWDNTQRMDFLENCEEVMNQYGYQIPVNHSTNKINVESSARKHISLTGISGSRPDDVAIGNVAEILDFPEVMNIPTESEGVPYDQWKMEINDAPILRYLFRNFKPKRHLEFGTWQGFGTTLALEECDATVWTLNFPGGLIKENGEASYAHELSELPEMEEWADKMFLRKAGGPFYATDSIGFIGRHYLKKDLGNRVCQIYTDSMKWDIANYPADFFDTVFIDGGHWKDVVINDTRKALNVTRSGGLILWHDFCPEMYGQWEACTGVLDAISSIWDELRVEMKKIFWIQPSFILAGIKA